PGLEHRVGGLEKADRTGNISYDPDNHDLMTRLRAQKVAGIASDIAELEVDDPDGDASVLVLGWGGTYGPIAAGCRRVRATGRKVAHAHLRHLNPFPRNTGEKLTRKDFKTDQEVRWCPGCGDYAILAAMQSFMPELGIERERTVFVSGIGCAARFPYYMNTYGMHSIHGRAPAIATGLAASRPDLFVSVL